MLTSSVATPGCPEYASYTGTQLLTGIGLPVGFIFTQTNSFEFGVTQQSFGPTLGTITISNIHYTTVADAPNGPVLVSVFSENPLPSGPGVAFQTNVSNAIIGTGQFLSIGSAVGVTTSGPFTISTKIVKKGSYVTIRFQTTPALAGADIGIWVAKWSNGAWSAFKPHTGRTANGSGVVYYYYKTTSAVKLSFRGFVEPNGIHGSGWSSGTEVLWTK